MAEKITSVALSTSAWTKLAEDCDYVQLQVGSNSDAMLVQVATSLPDPSVVAGFRLNGSDLTWPSPPLTNGTDIVYGRAIGRACTATVLAL